jgi:hypothetical protein
MWIDQLQLTLKGMNDSLSQIGSFILFKMIGCNLIVLRVLVLFFYYEILCVYLVVKILKYDVFFDENFDKSMIMI